MSSEHCPYKVLTLGEEMFLLGECHNLDYIDLPPKSRPPLLAYHTPDDQSTIQSTGVSDRATLPCLHNEDFGGETKGSSELIPSFILNME